MVLIGTHIFEDGTMVDLIGHELYASKEGTERVKFGMASKDERERWWFRTCWDDEPERYDSLIGLLADMGQRARYKMEANTWN